MTTWKVQVVQKKKTAFYNCEKNCTVVATSPQRFPFSLKRSKSLKHFTEQVPLSAKSLTFLNSQFVNLCCLLLPEIQIFVISNQKSFPKSLETHLLPSPPPFFRYFISFLSRPFEAHKAKVFFVDEDFVTKKEYIRRGRSIFCCRLTGSIPPPFPPSASVGKLCMYTPATHREEKAQREVRMMLWRLKGGGEVEPNWKTEKNS